jgi:uncharacterized membrane protein YtjA (UPF0391 family)
MLYWALVFLVVVLIAGVLGFTGIAVAAAGIAKLLFVIFLVPVSDFFNCPSWKGPGSA